MALSYRFIEVSHTIRAGMRTYPDLPEPAVETLWSYEDSRPRYANQAEFYIASLRLCGNTGTYVDAPIHRFRGAADLSAYPLEKLAHLDTVVLDAMGATRRAIGPELLKDQPVGDCAVLFRTGWSRHWGTSAYFEGSPYLSRAASEMLAEARVRFVGIDSMNIDDPADPSRPAHTILLGAGIPICEHMTNLAAVPGRGGFLHAVPIALVGGASFPVRAYVMVPL